MQIPADGGSPRPLAPLIDGEVTQRWPQVLPGGRSVLYTSSRVIGAFDDANLVVLVLSTGARKLVQRGGYHGRYLRSGHLVYIHEGALFAAPFDLGRLEVTGQSVAVLDGIHSNSFSASTQFSTSDNGTLVYVPGQSNGSSAPIHWMDRNGKTTLLRAQTANWSNIRFAPDGRRLAVEILDGQNDIWVYDWARDVMTPLTSDPASDTSPVWTPDGRRIVFASTRANPAVPNLYWQRVDGAGEAQRLTESKKRQRPVSWHPDGKFLAFEEFDEQGRSDLMILPVTGDEQSGWKAGTPRPFMTSLASATEPSFSPDGRWLAYSSTETGRDEVYVRPFPGPGAKTQISTGGGQFPTWSRARHELLFNTGISGQIMAGPFSTAGDVFQAETPRPWPEGRFENRGPWRMFDLHPDGERLGLRPGAGNVPQSHVTFVFNFADDLKARVPTK
jgi:serine/threonine-protein kinase